MEIKRAVNALTALPGVGLRLWVFGLQRDEGETACLRILPIGIEIAIEIGIDSVGTVLPIPIAIPISISISIIFPNRP